MSVLALGRGLGVGRDPELLAARVGTGGLLNPCKFSRLGRGPELQTADSLVSDQPMEPRCTSLWHIICGDYHG